jgi:excisionase family DNA binding protein
MNGEHKTAGGISPSGLMRPKAAAEYLGVTESTLSVWRSTNRQKLAYVKMGHLCMYRKTDLDEFINARLVNHVG